MEQTWMGFDTLHPHRRITIKNKKAFFMSPASFLFYYNRKYTKEKGLIQICFSSKNAILLLP